MFAECLAGGLTGGDQRRRTGSGSTSEALRDDALYRYMFALLYLSASESVHLISILHQQQHSMHLRQTSVTDNFKQHSLTNDWNFSIQ